MNIFQIFGLKIPSIHIHICTWSGVRTNLAPPEAIGFRLRWYPGENEVVVNLELGPMASVLDDYFFGDRAGPLLAITALDLLPEQR
mgnify:CR=1 FL=1